MGCIVGWGRGVLWLMVEAIDGYRWVKSLTLLISSHLIHMASADTADISR